jgi:hypothetical protein
VASSWVILNSCFLFDVDAITTVAARIGRETGRETGECGGAGGGTDPAEMGAKMGALRLRRKMQKIGEVCGTPLLQKRFGTIQSFNKYGVHSA